MNISTHEISANKWNAELKRQYQAQKYPKWPNEVMVKTLFGGSYLKNPFNLSPQMRVLDVGCGFGNNLIPFEDIGCECHGVDVHPEMAKIAQFVMDERGYKTQLQAGTNCLLPFPDDHFDLLLSVNTIHYEGNHENILMALKEFRRVLKPNGGVYISTVGPEHEIYKKAKVLGQHKYRVQSFDFRDDEELFFFDTEKYLEYYCAQFFNSVETGRVTEKLPNMHLDFLVCFCQ
ncbi:MAG: class I SAM-dependent methyltransferase [Cohaesibacteraceae bacterium]|nr:class I SAM-dependent methyltransferase [Cohaesibacteraceae bacterium]